uniref:Adenylate kinase 7 n=1 Tax=Rousettus aegyptiacus TaxID=9407 RepID=A0A7J8IED5_ROUAE|nr:adenylate kinase 7 [Rousettus aegyptiacus]
MTEEEEVVVRTEKVTRIQRVFINLLDSYSSRNIGKFLSNCVVGASLEEITEEEEEEDESKSAMPEASSPRLKEGTFQVVGTLSAPPREPEPDFAVETYTAISREDLLMRLLEWDINTEDETVFNYFDELEIHPIHIDVGKLEDAQNRLATTRLIKEIGKPRNYGLTDEEKAEEERRAAEEHIAKEATREAEREHREAVEMAEKLARWEEWNKRLEEVKREETELLEAQSIPLRNYLMTYVMPTLMQGLNECCKVRPEDPVDFLAEYLFKNNPETQ